MKTVSILAIGLLAAGAAVGATAQAPSTRTVSLVGAPLVMRLNKDEFRIAFGIDGKSCMPSGCSGLISYRVRWRAADGTARSDLKRVSYKVSPQAGRTIAVDRQYLDTAEGAQTTDVLRVSVDRITCLQDGA